jgi:hypothetical protein
MSGHEQLIIEINNSRQLLYLLFLIHGLAFVALVSLAIPLQATVVAVLLLIFSLSYTIKKTREVVRIAALSDNEWFIQKSDGSSFSAYLTGDTYISGWLTLLIFTSHENSSPTYVHLLADSVKASVLSQLKLRLKVSSQQLNSVAQDDTPV